MATLGGNLANGSPAAVPLPAAGAGCRGGAGGRARPAQDSPGRFLLRFAKDQDADRRSGYPSAAARRALSFQNWDAPKANLSGECGGRPSVGFPRAARNACASRWARVAPTPMRALSAEILVGRKVDENALAVVCDEVARAVRPITDVRASAKYRREMCRVLSGGRLKSAPPERGARYETMEVRLNVNGESKQWTIAPGESSPGCAAPRGLFRREARLRGGRMRRLHGAAQRPAHQFVPHVRRPGGRGGRADHRGTGHGDTLDPLQEAFWIMARCSVDSALQR